MAQDEEIVVEQVCGECGKTRTTEPDYTPIQPMTGQPLGWYSGEKDGELCPECITELMNLANRTDHYMAAKPL